MRLIHRIKKSTIFFIKLSVSLGLIVYLGWIVDWKQALITIKETTKLPLFVAPFFYWFSLGIASIRWRLILTDSKVAFSYWQAYAGYLVGMFYNIFLPGVIGGDAIRIGRCVKQTQCQIGMVTASVFLERISGVLVLMIMVPSVYLLFPKTFSPLLAVEATSTVTLAATIGIIVISVSLLGSRVCLEWLLKNEVKGRWRFIRSCMQMLRNLKGKTIGMVFVLSAMHQIIAEIIIAFLLSLAIGLDVPLSVFFAVIPFIYLTTVLPISLGGLGVREGMLVFLLAQFDVATTEAVTLSFLIYLNRVVVGSLGGILQLQEALSYKKVESTVKVDNTASLANKN